MKYFLVYILTNRNLILILGILCGFLFSSAAILLKPFAIPLIAAMMAVSSVSFKLQDFLPLKDNLKKILFANVLNYIIFSAILLSLAYIFINDKSVFNGFIFIALAPPGIVIVPFSIMLGGHTKTSIVGLVSGYLFLFVIFPAGVFFLLKTDQPLNYLELLKTLFFMILLPLLFSRLLRIQPVLKKIEKHRNILINWIFFLIIVIIIGLNKPVFFTDTTIILKNILVLTITYTLGSFLIDKLLKFRGLVREKRRTYILFATVKNTGFAAVMAINLLGNKAAMPSAVMSVVLLIYLIVVSKLWGSKKTKT